MQRKILEKNYEMILLSFFLRAQSALKAGEKCGFIFFQKHEVKCKRFQSKFKLDSQSAFLSLRVFGLLFSSL